jgi:hypothetical protein
MARNSAAARIDVASHALQIARRAVRRASGRVTMAAANDRPPRNFSALGRN